MSSFPTPPINASIPDHIEWTGCEGVGLAVEGPAMLYNGTRPADWPSAAESSPSANLADLYYQVFQCQRVSWGPFERGPIWVMLERHGDFVPPEKCREGDYSLHVFLQSIWFNDTDLVDYARNVYGMPAFFGEFSYSAQQQGSAIQYRWAWGPSESPPSEITQLGIEGNFLGHLELVWRTFWLNGDSVGFIDILKADDSPQLGPDTAWGQLHSPTLYGEGMPDPSFATDRSDLLTNMTLSAQVHRFGDTQCARPL